MSILSKLNDQYHLKNYNFTLSKIDGVDYQSSFSFKNFKGLHSSPIECAEYHTKILSKLSCFKKVFASSPGFINIILNESFLIECLEETLENNTTYNKNIFIDFGGPNIAKPLHVGHLRSFNIGESLSRIYKACGYNVITDIHWGDWGLQMGMIISEIISENLKDLTSKDLEILYPKISQKCKVDKKRYDLAVKTTFKLQSGDPIINNIWKKIKILSTSNQMECYKKLDINFNILNGESDSQETFNILLPEIIHKGIAQKSNGCLVIDVKEKEDKKEIPPLILCNSEGCLLYGGSDIATLYERILNYNLEKIIYVTDSRQENHFKQVFRGICKIIKSPELCHVGFGTVNNKEGKPFKTRDGNTVTLDSLLEEAKDKVFSLLPDKSNKEIVAEQIGYSALKFYDLLSPYQSGYIFDIEQMISLTGKTGPYVLYQAVRCKSLMDDNINNFISYKFNIYEKNLLLKIAQYEDAIVASMKKNMPHILAEYLYDLSKAFSQFYENCSLKCVTGDILHNRKFLCNKTFKIMEKSTYCLGMSIPEWM